MQKETELPWVVGYILMAASNVEGAPDKRLLTLAAKACNTMIGSGAGKMGIEIARKTGKDIQFEDE
jgi:hypothetical protein